LGGFVVIGSDDQSSIRAGFFGMLGQKQRRVGVVAAGAGDDLHSAGGVFDAEIHGGNMLFQTLGGRFAGGAADDHSVRTRRGLEVNQFSQLWKIDAAVSQKRSDDGHARSFKYRLSHNDPPSKIMQSD
jgi:hypothetical protein